MDSLSRQGPITKLKPHTQLEEYLERYVGLMLFVKEIDEQRYHQICAVGDFAKPTSK